MAFDRTNAERQRRYIRNLKERAARSVSNAKADTSKKELAAKIDPLLDAIFEMVLRPPATYSAPTTELIKIERILVAAGIMPESRRTNDAIAYARELTRKHDARLHSTLEASNRAHEEKRARQQRLNTIAEEFAPLRRFIDSKDAPNETMQIAKLADEARELIHTDAGPPPTTTQRALTKWKRQISARWEEYCLRCLHIHGSTAEHYRRKLQGKVSNGVVSNVSNGLEWKESGDPPHFVAQTKDGQYSLSPAQDFSSMKFVGYMISFHPTGVKYENRDQLRNGVKTAEQAKAVAQAHYDKATHQCVTQ